MEWEWSCQGLGTAMGTINGAMSGFDGIGDSTEGGHERSHRGWLAKFKHSALVTATLEKRAMLVTFICHNPEILAQMLILPRYFIKTHRVVPSSSYTLT